MESPSARRFRVGAGFVLGAVAGVTTVNTFGRRPFGVGDWIAFGAVCIVVAWFLYASAESHFKG